MRHILDGHPLFVRVLAGVLAAGHEIVMLPGNHDPEVQWEPVQDVVRRALHAEPLRSAGVGSGGAAAAQRAIQCLHFESWFHHEPGRIWIEHGCQYDPENAFKYPLGRAAASLPDEVHRKEVDLPLGTLFQRYLYNTFGRITFIVPNSRSNFRYFRWLLLNRPRLLARVATVHQPFLLQILRRLAKLPPSDESLRQAHEAELAELVARSPVGERLHLVDQLKQVQDSAALLAWQITVRIVKATGYVLLTAVFAAVLWFLGFQAIRTMQAGFGFKALLFLTLNFLFFLGAVGAASYFLMRPAGIAEDPRMRRAAAKVADLAAVPIVTLGAQPRGGDRAGEDRAGPAGLVLQHRDMDRRVHGRHAAPARAGAVHVPARPWPHRRALALEPGGARGRPDDAGVSGSRPRVLGRCSSS